jgi:hypothetical protein
MQADGFALRGLGQTKKAGTPTLPNGAKNVNGTSQKRGTIFRLLPGICDIVPIQVQIFRDMFVGALFMLSSRIDEP